MVEYLIYRDPDMLGIPFLSSFELFVACSMTLFVRGEVTCQGQEMVDFGYEAARNLRLPLAMAAG